MARGRTTMRGTKAMAASRPGRTTMRGSRTLGSAAPGKTTIKGSDPTFGRKAESGLSSGTPKNLPGRPY